MSGLPIQELSKFAVDDKESTTKHRERHEMKYHIVCKELSIDEFLETDNKQDVEKRTNEIVWLVPEYPTVYVSTDKDVNWNLSKIPGSYYKYEQKGPKQLV